MGSLVPITPMHAMNMDGSDKEEESKEAAAAVSLSWDEMRLTGEKWMQTADTTERENLIDQFMEHHGSIDVKSTQDHTMLMLAVKTGDVGLAQLLLDKGSDVNAKTKGQETPLMYIKEPSTSVDMINLLLEKGADVKAITIFGANTLNYLVPYCSVKGIQILLNSGANVYPINNNGHTALSYAIEYNKCDMAQFLILAGLDGKEMIERDTLSKEQLNSTNERLTHFYLQRNGAEFLEKLKYAQQAKEDLEERDWSIETLATSDVFRDLNIPTELVRIIATLGSSLTQDETMNSWIEWVMAEKEASELKAVA